VPWSITRREGIPLLPDCFNTTVVDLAIAYGNVFRAFLDTEETYTSLRLTSFFDVYSCGLSTNKIAGLTYAALDRAFRALPSPSLQTLLRRLWKEQTTRGVPPPYLHFCIHDPDLVLAFFDVFNRARLATSAAAHLNSILTFLESPVCASPACGLGISSPATTTCSARAAHLCHAHASGHRGRLTCTCPACAQSFLWSFIWSLAFAPALYPGVEHLSGGFSILPRPPRESLLNLFPVSCSSMAILSAILRETGRNVPHDRRSS